MSSKRFLNLLLVPVLAVLVGCGGESGGTIVPEPIPFGGLLSDGDFENDIGDWFGNALDVVDDGGNLVNFADVTVAGQPFDVNLSQVVPITQGKRYTLSFKAKTNAVAALRSGDTLAAPTATTRTIFAGIGLNQEPWTNTTQEVTLTPEWQTFTQTLDASNFGSENSRVIYDMGADTGEVFLDDVILEEVGDIPAGDGSLVNGDFESEGGWIGNAFNIVDDTGNRVNSADVETAGNSFDVNLSQIVAIAQGKNFKLTFKARTDDSRTIFAGIGLNEDPWTNDTKEVTLTSDWQTFELDLSSADFGSANSRVIFDMGADTGLVLLDDVVLEEITNPGDELLSNGSFEDGTTSWIGNAANVPNELLGFDGSLANFASVDVAGQSFDVNLSQVVPITQGETYTLSFKAKSDGNRTMLAGIGLNEDPWTNITEEVSLTTDWQTFTLTLPATDFGGTNSRVLFDMGADTGQVIIDDVSLVGSETPPPSSTLALTVSANGASAVRITGPFWNWDPAGGPEATDNGDGTWTVTLDSAPAADMEYLWVVDGVQENLVDNDPQDFSCTPITDNATYANRQWTVGSANVTDDVYDACSATPPPAAALTLTVSASGASAVRITGPFWDWDPAGGPEATDNGDGTWTVTLDPAPAADMEYLWVVDGVQENLVDNDPQDFSCTPITDNATYANRQWTVGSANVTDDVYDACSATPPPAAALTLTVSASGASAVRITGPFWGWDPAGGPEATDNGDGTWTVTLDPAPAADMEYLWVVDGVQENLVDNNTQDFSCTPVTDGANYANRQWTVGSANVTGDIYDACSIAPPPPTENQVDLPVTFDETGVDYTLTDFGGNASTLVADPTDAGNMVVSTVKAGDAELWAGTTIGNSANAAADQGFATVIPFTASATTMSVRVYSPDPGVIVRLKVERSNDDTVTAETESLTTTSGEWETLVFDLNNVATGTAAFDATAGYDKASIFFNFGTDGATAGEKTYLWDDIEFGGSVAPPPPSSLTLTVSASGASAVRITGPFWGWDPAGGPEATDNGDGTWTVTLDPAPTADMEYLWVVDGVQENLVDNNPQDFSCTPVTDGASYANRQWTAGSANVTGDIYDACSIAPPPASALTLTVSASGASAVRMTGPFWNWDPAGGPEATSNGDGTWTVTLDPAPTADMEYLWIADGIQENLVDNNPQDFSCTPVTDSATYANRQWTAGSANVTGDIYDACSGGTPPVTGELTTNGDLETGDLSGWALYNVLPVISTDSASGTYAANLVVGEAQVSVLKQERIAAGTVMTGQTLNITFKMKGSAGAGGVINPNLIFEDDISGASNQILETIAVPTAGYTTYSYTPTITGNVSNGISLEFAAACGAVAGCNANVVIDDVSITIQ